MQKVDDFSHNVSSFLRHGGHIRRESGKNALKFQFTVTIHRVSLSDAVKIKHPEWEWVVVWSRGAKIAATFNAKGRPTQGGGTEIVWQQELTLLGTAFRDKTGGFAEKTCKFSLKQSKADKSHATVGKVKLNLAEHIAVEDRETVLELRLRDKKNNAIGSMSITLACRFLKDYGRDTGTCASGMSEISVESAMQNDSDDDSRTKKGPSQTRSHNDKGSTGGGVGSASSAATTTLSPAAGGGGGGGGARTSSHFSPSSTVPTSAAGGGGGGAASSQESMISSLQSEVDELRRIVDEQHFENERLRDEVENLTEQLEKRKGLSEKLARNMTSYEVELLKTAEKQARVEAEVEERLTAAFVPVIQKLEAELAELKLQTSKGSNGDSGKSSSSSSRWGRR